MILNNIELIDTELGKVPVIINQVLEKGEIRYEGRLLDNEIKVFIQTPTFESCKMGLTNAFELQMHFWLYKELTPINIGFRK